MTNIYSEHFKLAHDKVAVILSLIFNAMVIHDYIPHYGYGYYRPIAIL